VPNDYLIVAAHRRTKTVLNHEGHEGHDVFTFVLFVFFVV